MGERPSPELKDAYNNIFIQYHVSILPQNNQRSVLNKVLHNVLFVADYFTPGACDLTFEKLKTLSLMAFNFLAISQTLRKIHSFTSTRKRKSPANTTV